MPYSQSNFKQSATNNKITKQCTKYSKSLLAIAVSTAFFQPVLAENNTAKNLDTIEITGSTSGISDNIITAEQLQNYQANDLEDVFILDPSVTVGGSIGVAQKVYVRGLEDTLVNITIDSAPQSGQLFHHNGRISLEPELIKQIEVSAGAGEATNGAGALGGAIRFVTKDPEDLLRDGEQFGALIKSNYFSNTDAYKASATLFGRLNEDLSAMISYITSEGDNFEDGDSNELEGTESDSEIGFAKIVAHITDSQTFRISYDNIKDEGDRAQRPQWVVSDWNKLYPMETERKTTTASYELNPDENEVLNFKFTGYQSEQDLFQDGRFGPYKGSIETLGFDLRNTSLFDQHEVIYGTDYRKDKNYLGPGNDPKLDKEDINISGIYVQDHFQITN
ncbi:MAG: hemoglobin/transferrin/lactoferrin receptor protein, partial [Glaciecola sp.]